MDLGWELKGKDHGDYARDIACAIAGTARDIVQEHAGDLKELLPLSQLFRFQAHFSSAGWFALRITFIPGMTMIVGPLMQESDVLYLTQKLGETVPNEPQQIRSLLGAEWFAVDRFTYVGPYNGNRVSWQDIEKHLRFWLAEVALPDALDRNRTRVLRAVPPPPSYDVAKISRALWALECDEACKQGTAFSLKGMGLVTCDHVLGSATRAFRYDKPAEKYPVMVIARNSAVDLAVLSITATASFELETGDATAVKQMDHILVAGHPNYRSGDSPLTIPGLIVGERTKSAVKRFLTNAAIVAGGSGSPVVDKHGLVIGVAVTGADSFAKVPETEDLGIIPIEALSLLQTDRSSA